ncbi:MAG TPA: hypothetical protein VGV89_10360 [Thermoplasmata archaeon]|nr:hypothetical protein [Thermoplasmata archaeon]
MLVLFVGVTSGSSISPVPPPSGGSADCPSLPLLPGSRADFGALVALLQPGLSSTQDCALEAGGTLVGSQIIVLLYTPNAVPNSSVNIEVKEYTTQTVSFTEKGPNGTQFNGTKLVDTNVVYSNATIGAQAGEVDQFELNVPPVGAQENLTIGILGAITTVQIVTPGAGIPIPANYPELLLHDFGFQIIVIIAFVVGIGVATAVRKKARHIDRLWPFGLVGVFATIGFGSWFLVDYPLSAIPLGSAPEAAVAAPVVLAGVYLWLALFPTEAKIYRVEFPVADVRGGYALYDAKEFRLFDGPDGPEYIGPGGAGAFLRFLGVRTLLDDRVLTPTPHKIGFNGFTSIRRHIFAKYYAWAEVDGRKVLDVVPPRFWIFPWRARAREAIAAFHAKELKGRAIPPTHPGFFLYVSPSRAFLRAVGPKVGQLVRDWIQGTVHVSQIGDALEQILVQNSNLKVTLKAKSLDHGAKLALIFRYAEEMPGSPVALKALEDYQTRIESELLDQTDWHQYLQAEVADESSRPPQRTVPPTTEAMLHEASNPTPPDMRSRKRGAGS